MAGGQVDAGVVGGFADDGELVGSGGAEAGPRADGGDGAEAGHVFDGADQHAREHGGIDGWIFGTELTRGTDEELARFARLRVEGDGIRLQRVGAFEIAEFDELVVDEAGITVSNEEMAFAGLDIEMGKHLAGGGAGGEDSVGGGERDAVIEASVSLLRVDDAATYIYDGAEMAGLGDEIARGARRVDDGILREDEATGQAGTEAGFGGCERLSVEDFDGEVAIGVIGVFAMDFVHFHVVGGDPERAAREIFDVGWELGDEVAPEGLGVAGEGELGGRVIHDGEMAHAGGGSATADFGRFDDGDFETVAGELPGAGGTDDASAGNGDVEGWGGLRH